MAKPLTLAGPGIAQQPATPAVRWHKVCPVCLQAFTSERSDATTCRDYCRQQRAKWNRVMRRELTDAESEDDYLAWLGTKVKGRVTFLEDGTPHVHWKLTGRIIYWINLYCVTSGTKWDDAMEDLARPLVQRARDRRK